MVKLLVNSTYSEDKSSDLKILWRYESISFWVPNVGSKLLNKQGANRIICCVSATPVNDN